MKCPNCEKNEVETINVKGKCNNCQRWFILPKKTAFVLIPAELEAVRTLLIGHIETLDGFYEDEGYFFSTEFSQIFKNSGPTLKKLAEEIEVEK